ncbi:hypothetical protein G6F22_020154 [Rhizopus arrhizus]|nr:hypothetical protein G6F22_020154 [Rhizopus arrhizus]
MQLHLSTSPAPADLIPERFDLAIRLGRLPDSGLHASELEQHPLCAVAAPSLLERLPSADAADDPAQLGTLPRLGYPRLADVPWYAWMAPAACAPSPWPVLGSPFCPTG